MNFFLKTFSVLFILICSVTAQQTQNNKNFIELVSVNPNIKLDLRYAADNNFLEKAVYPQARCFLRFEVAVHLDSVQQELETIGLGLKVFDGYRPLSVQKMMWKILPDDRYVANPEYGSRHNRGAAVDLTLVDSAGKDLQMPTPFDDFTEKAHHDYRGIPDKVKQNRWILKTVMEKYGFKKLDSEWWHYDFYNWRSYEVADVSFDEILQGQK